MKQLIPTESAEMMEASAEGQSNSVELDCVPTRISSRRGATAADFGRTIGSIDLGTLRQHHLAVAMAVIELAADADDPLPWSHDDPTVALARAVAKIALTAPDATSSAAADLIDRLLDTA